MGRVSEPGRNPPAMKAAPSPATNYPAADFPPMPRWTPAELKKRRARALAMAVALGVIVLIFYVVTIAKLGPQVLNRPL